MEHLDVVIVGAGLSGIGMAWHLQDRCPGKSYAVLEAREASGGTWDLFRYPGVRSDSDMQTLGYRFKPWTGSKALADGPSILSYVRETAAEAGIDAHIRYGHRVVRAEWSTPDARWTVHVEGRDPLTCRFLLMCSGYYRYDEGFTPPFEGREDFGGEIVHPQLWPEDLDFAGKRVVVIGSGATAVTLVPALARSGAGHVTMLQRSPSYILSCQTRTRSRTRCGPGSESGGPTRSCAGRTSPLATLLFQLSQRFPAPDAQLYRAGARASCPPAMRSTPTSTRATSRGTSGCASSPTATSSRRSRTGARRSSPPSRALHRRGIRLRDGSELEADVIITATGLNLLLFGGMELASTASRSTCRARWPTSR